MGDGVIRRLGLAQHGRTVSAQEFTDAEFDEPYIYEREDGRLLVFAPDNSTHVLALHPWRNRLILFQYASPGHIQQVVTQNWVRPDMDTDRIGDIGVFLAVRTFDVPDEAPDLMFEIVRGGKSKRFRDYVIKRKEYEALRIKEYIIVDRFIRKVTVLSLSNGHYSERILTEADIYTSPLLPGFSVALSEIF